MDDTGIEDAFGQNVKFVKKIIRAGLLIDARYFQAISEIECVPDSFFHQLGQREDKPLKFLRSCYFSYALAFIKGLCLAGNFSKSSSGSDDLIILGIQECRYRQISDLIEITSWAHPRLQNARLLRLNLSDSKVIHEFSVGNEFVKKITQAGALMETQRPRAVSKIDCVPDEFFRQLRGNCDTSFDFLQNCSFDAALGFMKGLCLAEQFRRIGGGSVSLIIPAYHLCKYREFAELAEITDWIVLNHKNPYTPFNFQSTRAYWLAARHGSRDPEHTFSRVNDMILREERHRDYRAYGHQITLALQGLTRGESPSSETARNDIVDRLEREFLDGWN